MEIYQELQGGWYTGDSTTLAAQNQPFWVQLVQYDGSQYYGWIQQLPSDGGTFVPLDGGRFGSPTSNPAYEANGAVIDLEANPYVMLKRAYYAPALDWVYVIVTESPPTATLLTVQRSDGTESVTDITTLQVDPPSSWTVSSPSAGVVTISVITSGTGIGIEQLDGTHDVLGVTTIILDQSTGLAWEADLASTYTIQVLPASAIQDGVVTTVDQSFSGPKTFLSPISIYDNDSTWIEFVSNDVSPNQFVGGVNQAFGGSGAGQTFVPAIGITGEAGVGVSLVGSAFGPVILLMGVSGYPTIVLRAVTGGFPDLGGLTTTIGYTKSGGGTGVITVQSGLIVGVT